jgi:uncharacterized membrane protein
MEVVDGQQGLFPSSKIWCIFDSAGKYTEEEMLLLDLVTTICIGMLVGVEFSVSAFINPVVWKLDEYAQTAAVRLFSQRLGKAMPFWYSCALILLIIEAVARRHESSFLLLAIAAVIWIVVILLTMRLLVPINNRMARLQDGPVAAEVKGERRKWDSLNRLRITALVVALVCFLVATQR